MTPRIQTVISTRLKTKEQRSFMNGRGNQESLFQTALPRTNVFHISQAPLIKMGRIAPSY